MVGTDLGVAMWGLWIVVAVGIAVALFLGFRDRG